MHQRGRFRGRIRHGNKFKFTRWYDNPIDAAIARDALAVSIYGSKAVLNFGNNNEATSGPDQPTQQKEPI